MNNALDNLQRLYTFILALALTESLKEFAKPTGRNDPDGTLRERISPWPLWCDSLPALISVLVLVVPFFHGMNAYLEHTYKRVNPPHSTWLLLDIGVFMIEAVLLFLMSRNLPLARWRTFYGLVTVLLLVDAAWGATVFLKHSAASATMTWMMLNGAASILLFGSLWLQRGSWGAWFALAIVVGRTMLDYALCWQEYFPP